jgi:hypothetical protein
MYVNLRDEAMLSLFDMSAIPEFQRVVAFPYYILAITLVDALPQGKERSEALQKLLESRNLAMSAYGVHDINGLFIDFNDKGIN